MAQVKSDDAVISALLCRIFVVLRLIEINSWHCTFVQTERCFDTENLASEVIRESLVKHVDYTTYFIKQKSW